MLITDKRLRQLYRAMCAEPRGVATTNYILALSSRVQEKEMEVQTLSQRLEDVLDPPPTKPSER